ncbi:hypothetical protein LX36DRAFT_151810 [Colletotrichum falcatum]|nr:hypothetical protein LX36DRAFT_151810 [Colletotrichum falcatum]
MHVQKASCRAKPERCVDFFFFGGPRNRRSMGESWQRLFPLAFDAKGRRCKFSAARVSRPGDARVRRWCGGWRAASEERTFVSGGHVLHGRVGGGRSRSPSQAGPPFSLSLSLSLLASGDPFRHCPCRRRVRRGLTSSWLVSGRRQGGGTSELKLSLLEGKRRACVGQATNRCVAAEFAL